MWSLNSAVFHQLLVSSYTSINRQWYIMSWVTDESWNARQLRLFVATGLCMGISTVVVGLRLLGRRLIGVKLWWDDCVAVLALVYMNQILRVDCNSWHAMTSYSHTVPTYSLSSVHTHISSMYGSFRIDKRNYYRCYSWAGTAWGGGYPKWSKAHRSGWIFLYPAIGAIISILTTFRQFGFIQYSSVCAFSWSSQR